MTSRLNSSLLPLIFFSLLLVIWLTGLRAVAAADRPISIPVQITHAQNFDPFPSPDGKKLVFISMISGKEQLFTMDVDGSHAVQLTRDDADHEDPAWSPDGTSIAFVLITKDRHSIAVMGSWWQQRGSAHAAGAEYHPSKLVRGQQTRDLLHE